MTPRSNVKVIKLLTVDIIQLFFGPNRWRNCCLIELTKKNGYKIKTTFTFPINLLQSMKYKRLPTWETKSIRKIMMLRKRLQNMTLLPHQVISSKKSLSQLSPTETTKKNTLTTKVTLSALTLHLKWSFLRIWSKSSVNRSTSQKRRKYKLMSTFRKTVKKSRMQLSSSIFHLKMNTSLDTLIIKLASHQQMWLFPIPNTISTRKWHYLLTSPFMFAWQRRCWKQMKYL